MNFFCVVNKPSRNVWCFIANDAFLLFDCVGVTDFLFVDEAIEIEGVFQSNRLHLKRFAFF